MNHVVKDISAVGDTAQRSQRAAAEDTVHHTDRAEHSEDGRGRKDIDKGQAPGETPFRICVPQAPIGLKDMECGEAVNGSRDKHDPHNRPADLP